MGKVFIHMLVFNGVTVFGLTEWRTGVVGTS